MEHSSIGSRGGSCILVSDIIQIRVPVAKGQIPTAIGIAAAVQVSKSPVPLELPDMR